MSNKDIPPWVFYREQELKHAMLCLEGQIALYKHFTEAYSLKEIQQNEEIQKIYNVIIDQLLKVQKEVQEIKEKFKKDIC